MSFINNTQRVDENTTKIYKQIAYLESRVKRLIKENKTLKESKNAEIEKILQINEVLIKHIEILENRCRSFFDRFKFGRFRFVSIEEDLASKRLRHISKKESFKFNDDEEEE